MVGYHHGGYSMCVWECEFSGEDHSPRFESLDPSRGLGMVPVRLEQPQVDNGVGGPAPLRDEVVYQRGGPIALALHPNGERRAIGELDHSVYYVHIMQLLFSPSFAEIPPPQIQSALISAYKGFVPLCELYCIASCYRPCLKNCLTLTPENLNPRGMPSTSVQTSSIRPT